MWKNENFLLNDFLILGEKSKQSEENNSTTQKAKIQEHLDNLDKMIGNPDSFVEPEAPTKEVTNEPTSDSKMRLSSVGSENGLGKSKKKLPDKSQLLWLDPDEEKTRNRLSKEFVDTPGLDTPDLF